jgi:hypothetical protein
MASTRASYGPVLPVLNGLLKDFFVFRRDVGKDARRLPLPDKFIFGQRQGLLQPADAPLDVRVSGAPIGTEVSDKHFVLFDAYDLFGAPFVKGARAEQQRVLRLVGLAVVRVDFRPFGAEHDMPVVVLASFFLYPADSWTDG